MAAVVPELPKATASGCAGKRVAGLIDLGLRGGSRLLSSSVSVCSLEHPLAFDRMER